MANVTFTPNHQPAPACYPSDVNGFLDMLTTGGGLSGTIPDTAGGGVYVGSSPPSSALTNKVWYKTDGAGRPLGVFMFYNGNWRKVYTGAVLGEIRLYVGGFNGVFDGTGRGIIGGDADGWVICNGNNGTSNLEGYFPCGAAWDGSNWVANPAGSGNAVFGGARGPFLLNSYYLPKLTSYAYGSLNSAAGSGVYGVANAGATIVGDWPVLDANGNPVNGVNQAPLPFHLFAAMALMQFVGYQ
jgi:hypothetical protein